MDVKSLLNEEESAPRPCLQRFGPFKPRSSAPRCSDATQPQHTRLPPIQATVPSPQIRSLSYSSASSSSSRSTPSGSSASPLETLPSISARVPPLARSDSGGSQSPHSPATPSATPNPTPLRRLESDPLRLDSNIKSVPFINLPVPRPQIVSISSFSAAPSGPPSSMDSFATTPNSLGMGDFSFPPASQPQPYLLSPQTSLTGIPDQQPNSTSPPSSSSHTASAAPNSSSSSKPQKKNSYPCPLARQYACNEFFTTSGHAARHAKKHTGRKDAVCPECSKAFTRKDNMEQHRRTHAKESSNTASRNNSKTSSDKEESKQRKLMKFQQNRKSRQPSISASSVASSTPITNQINPATTPSVSSTLTSPTTDMSSRTSYPPAPGPLQMDGTLDPRLRESPSSAASGSVSAFSPTPFTPAVFSMPDTNPSVYPPNFNSVFASQAQMSLPQHINSHQLQPTTMNMTNTPILPPSMSSPESLGHRQPMPRGSYGGNLEYRLQPSPIVSPLSTVPDGLDMGLGMSMPTTTTLDTGLNTAMVGMMDHPIQMSPNAGPDMMTAPAIVAGGPLGASIAGHGMAMAPAFDKLSLDKLALAAEAARNNGN